MRNGPYIMLVAPEGYPGKRYRGRYAYEHHIVWWQNTGETIPAGYVIHHKNDDKHDNRLENLEMKTQEQHSRDHSTRPKEILVCAFCGDEFARNPGYIAAKRRQGQKGSSARDLTKSRCNGKKALAV